MLYTNISLTTESISDKFIMFYDYIKKTYYF